MLLFFVLYEADEAVKGSTHKGELAQTTAAILPSFLAHLSLFA